MWKLGDLLFQTWWEYKLGENLVFLLQNIVKTWWPRLELGQTINLVNFLIKNKTYWWPDVFYYVQTWWKLNGPFRNLLNTPGETKKPTEWERFVPDIVDAVIAYLLNIQIDPHLYSWLFEAGAATGPQRNNFFHSNHVKHI